MSLLLSKRTALWTVKMPRRRKRESTWFIKLCCFVNHHRFLWRCLKAHPLYFSGMGQITHKCTFDIWHSSRLSALLLSSSVGSCIYCDHAGPSDLSFCRGQWITLKELHCTTLSFMPDPCQLPHFMSMNNQTIELIWLCHSWSFIALNLGM